MIDWTKVEADYETMLSAPAHLERLHEADLQLLNIYVNRKQIERLRFETEQTQAFEAHKQSLPEVEQKGFEATRLRFSPDKQLQKAILHLETEKKRRIKLPPHLDFHLLADEPDRASRLSRADAERVLVEVERQMGEWTTSFSLAEINDPDLSGRLRPEAWWPEHLTLLRAAIVERLQPDDSILSQIKPSEPEPQVLEALFPDGEAEKYIGMLRQVNPPIIGDNDRYRLGVRQKGAFVAWAKFVEPHFLEKVPEKRLARLLNERFPGLEISERTLFNLETSAYRRYKTLFLRL